MKEISQKQYETRKDKPKKEREVGQKDVNIIEYNIKF